MSMFHVKQPKIQSGLPNDAYRDGKSVKITS